MSNIIEFKRKPSGPKEDWISDISFFEIDGEYKAKINSASVEMGLTDAEMLRKIADCLDTISFMARQEAEKYETTEKGSALVVVTVFHDGTVRTRLDDHKIISKEQICWAADCVSLGAEEIRGSDD